MGEKKIHHLEELIRTATDHLLTNEEKISYLTDPKLKDRLYGKFPECFISMKRMGRDTSAYLLPLCNRAGIIDPMVINIAFKMISKIMSDQSGMFDINELQSVLDKITRLKDRYDKATPKPPQAAGRKAVVTRMFNNIKKHLVTISQKD